MDIQAMLSFLGEPHPSRLYNAVDLSSVLLCALTLSGCVFERTRFTRSQFVSVDFRDADLQGSDLVDCTFIDCCFEGALMKGAVLHNSVFKNVTGLVQQQVNEAKGNGQVLLPGQLTLPRDWLDA